MSDDKQTQLMTIEEEEDFDIQISPTDRLIMMAVKGNADIDKLEKLIDLKNREEERLAKLAFDQHFAAMQKEYVPVSRDKTARDGDKILYAYAPLETILRTYAPIITKYGFSYSWKEEPADENKKVKVTCVVSGYGHTREFPIEIPLPPTTKFANAIQTRGIASTYGRRYSFIGAFGVIIEDEDDDSSSIKGVNEKTIAEAQAERVINGIRKGRQEIEKLIEQYEPLVAPEVINVSRLDMEAADTIEKLQLVYLSLRQQGRAAEMDETRERSKKSFAEAAKKVAAQEPTVEELEAEAMEGQQEIF